MGQADVDERTIPAVIPRLSRWSFTGLVEAVHLGCKRFCPDAELGREFYFEPAARLAVKDGTAWNRLAYHFFKTERLRAKLDQVAIVRFMPAALVFDRKGFRMKLDDIGAAGETEAATGEGKAADGAKIMPPRLPGEVGLLMEKPALRGKAVLCPCLLKVDQGPLTRTERKMLQSTQWKSVLGFLLSEEIRSRRFLPE
jgi:hypothetical protein